MFQLPTKIYDDFGSLSVLSTLPYQKVFLICDPFVTKSGVIDTITVHLKGTYEIFDNIVPDPPLDVVTEGITKLLAFQPDAVLAVGGGSAIDAAKAIKDFASKITGGPAIAFIAVPTTSGTGSEVTSFAVITDKGRKYPLVSDALLPDVAILDAELVLSVPKPITADTGMDVLTHAIESYVSTRRDAYAEALAEKAVCLVAGNLAKAYENGNDRAARKNMHTASCLAGLAFNHTSLGLNHAIAHNIGARLHIPHGRCNAMLLPYVIEFNAGLQGFTEPNTNATAQQYAALARLLHLSGSNPAVGVRSLIRFIKELQRKLGMPTKLSDCGVTAEQLATEENAIAEGALLDGCMVTNPRPANKQEIIEILRKML